MWHDSHNGTGGDGCMKVGAAGASATSYSEGCLDFKHSMVWCLT